MTLVAFSRTSRLVLLAIAVLCGSAQAHHGWRWTKSGNFEVVGIIETVKLGNPHGVLTLDVDGEKWTIEVGQPWRNERAGIEEGMLSIGEEVTISGQRSADAAERRVKAERVIIGTKTYDLYPDRD